MTQTVVVPGEGQLGIMIGVYQDSVDPAVARDWWSLHRNVVRPAVDRIRAIRLSNDYTLDGAQKRIAAVVDETLRTPAIQVLRVQVERGEARRSEFRQTMLQPPVTSVRDFQSFYEAMIARDEAKEMASSLGRDRVAIIARYAEAIEERDQFALRALYPLRRHLSEEERAAIDAQLLAISPRAAELRTCSRVCMSMNSFPGSTVVALGITSPTQWGARSHCSTDREQSRPSTPTSRSGRQRSLARLQPMTTHSPVESWMEPGFTTTARGTTGGCSDSCTKTLTRNSAPVICILSPGTRRRAGESCRTHRVGRLAGIRQAAVPRDAPQMESQVSPTTGSQRASREAARRGVRAIECLIPRALSLARPGTLSTTIMTSTTDMDIDTA
jgi:hypothetical protein